MSIFGPDSSAMPWLPGHIVSSSGPLSYIVQLPEGRTFRCHIYHIRKHTISYLELDHEQVTSPEFTEVVELEESEVVSPVASSDSCPTQHGSKRQMSTALHHLTSEVRWCSLCSSKSCAVVNHVQ